MTFLPLDSDIYPRFCGISTFFRLPYFNIDSLPKLDIAVLGIPWDGSATDRRGSALGPREVRNASGYARLMHGVHLNRPFEDTSVADIGDVPVNPINEEVTFGYIREWIGVLKMNQICPLIVGGDHLISLPVLEALASDGPIALVQFDAHLDTWDTDFAKETHSHGTPFRRAIEQGLIDPKKSLQIAIRELIHNPQDLAFSNQSGMTVITVDSFQLIGIEAVIKKIREVVGLAKVYITLDIDCLDPAFAPGTGTPEPGGITTHELMKLIRGLKGLDVIGADLVEVAPPYDPAGVTSLAAASLLYEILSIMSFVSKSKSHTKSLRIDK